VVDRCLEVEVVVDNTLRIRNFRSQVVLIPVGRTSLVILTTSPAGQFLFLREAAVRYHRQVFRGCQKSLGLLKQGGS